MKIPELSSKLKSDENSRITIQILINTQPFWRSIADCAKPKKVQLQFLSTPQLVAINTQDETKEEKKARRAAAKSAKKVRCVSAQKLVTTCGHIHAGRNRRGDNGQKGALCVRTKTCNKLPHKQGKEGIRGQRRRHGADTVFFL